MKVCIIRNAELETNAGMIRIVDALLEQGKELVVLSRTRTKKDKYKMYNKKFFEYNDRKVLNYEIQLNAKMGKGLKNIWNLIVYQVFVFMWLVRNVKKYDILHVFDLDAGLPAIFISLFFKKKMLYHIADFYVDSRKGIPNSFKKYIRKLEYYIIAKSDATIICTEDRKKQIEGSKPKKLYIIHNTPTKKLDVTVHKELKKSDILSLCYIGALSNNRFINEILEIVSKNKSIELKIAGMGALEEKVKEYSSKYSNIIFLGQVNYNEALKIYLNCDLMFAIYDPSHSNHRYSAPNKVYEAMMLGKPIIVAKNTGTDTIVKKEKMGFTIKYDKNSFEKLINKILCDKTIIYEMGQNAKNAYEKYSWESMKKNIEKLYNEFKVEVK